VKKFIVAGLAALGLVLASQQQAAAWSKFSFNAGVSINYEGGNNNFLWGAFRGGQVPGYPTDVYMGQNAYPGCAFGYPGAVDYGYAGGYQGGYVAPAPQQDAPKQQAETRALYQPNYYYQPVSYQSYGYYPYASQSYGYGAGYGQVPSYWYGR
jgi:hypothetical protein